MARRVTINMIAEKAGVSRGTVDRVLNQRPHVRPEARDAVIRAMKELEYEPSRQEVAEALGLNTSGLRGFKLGVIFPAWSGFWTGFLKDELLQGINDAKWLLLDQKIEVITAQCEMAVPGEILRHIDEMMAHNVKGIALCAMNVPAVEEKINELAGKGIPVVTFNNDVPMSQRLSYVSQDPEQSGRIAGDLMMKLIRKDEKLLVAIGNEEFDAHARRRKGFLKVIEEKRFPKENIISIETYNDYMVTYNKVLDTLEKNAGIKGIYMANHSVTGCADAVRTIGKAGDVHIIAHDLTDTTRKLLAEGEIDFTIGQNIYRQGYRPLIILKEYIQKGIRPEKEETNIPIDIYCAENMSYSAGM